MTSTATRPGRILPAMPPRPPIDAESLRELIRATLPPAARAGGRIFGAGGALDSLGLVNFLADLEARLAERHGREFVLASERAMSRAQSPFRDVETLTTFILELAAP